jgi:hypothetical protein
MHHTGSTLAAANGESLHAIKKCVGYATITMTTDLYAAPLTTPISGSARRWSSYSAADFDPQKQHDERRGRNHQENANAKSVDNSLAISGCASGIVTRFAVSPGHADASLGMGGKFSMINLLQRSLDRRRVLVGGLAAGGALALNG